MMIHTKIYVFAVVSLAASLSARLAIADAEAKETKFQLTSAEHKMVEAVNKYRDKQGLPPLSVDPTLMRVARQSAPYFSHTVNGQWCWHRCKQAGFTGWATDNIANGYPTPEDAVVGWSTSHGHAMQMRGFFKMNGRWQDYRFNRIGVGISGRKYIAVFGRDNRHQVAKEVTQDDDAS